MDYSLHKPRVSSLPFSVVGLGSGDFNFFGDSRNMPWLLALLKRRSVSSANIAKTFQMVLACRDWAGPTS